MANLSGYRVMWMLVLFDLPVVEPEERKAANRFRLYLKDMGFSMSQFSVYARFTSGKESVEAYIRKIEAALPPSGKVSILQFTDKQYENIITFRSRSRDASGEKPPPQLELF